MWLVANEDVKGVCDSVDIHKGERILMEMSRKFTLEDIRQLAFQSNFYVQVAVCSCPTLLWQPPGSASQPPGSAHNPLGLPHAVKQLSCSHISASDLFQISRILSVRSEQKHVCSTASMSNMYHTSTALPSLFFV